MINRTIDIFDIVHDVISLLEKLVKYDTRTNENSPGKDVKELLEKEIEPQFKKYGFNIEYFESRGHYSILASRAGIQPSVLFSGHVDVVPWDDRWDTDPQTMVITREMGEEIVIGRGVSDMKCGIAALMTALPEIAKSDLTLHFALTGDEEIGGEDGTKVIVDHLTREDKLPLYVITADAAGMEIITRRRNVFDLFASSKKSLKTLIGRKERKTFQTQITSSLTSHAAYYDKDQDKHCLKQAIEFLVKNGYFPVSVLGNFVKINVVPEKVELEYIIPNDEGEENLIDEGLNALLQFASKVMDISFETEAHSDYGINSTANVLHDTADSWEIEIDIRAMLDKEAEQLDGALLLILDEIDWDLDMLVKKSIGFIATTDDSPLVKSTTEILKNIGYPYKSAERGGATDGRFFAQHGIQTIDIGAIGWNVHGPNETSTTKSIIDLVKFFELVPENLKKYYEM